jgi:hypothetical protein
MFFESAVLAVKLAQLPADRNAELANSCALLELFAIYLAQTNRQNPLRLFGTRVAYSGDVPAIGGQFFSTKVGT